VRVALKRAGECLAVGLVVAFIVVLVPAHSRTTVAIVLVVVAGGLGAWAHKARRQST
jgi:hypothetical protein